MAGGTEAALDLQSPWALALMSATFFVMPFLIKRFDDASLRYFAWSVYAVSILGFVFGYFYTAVGYKIFPQPLLILIAPPRAMKFYTFFFGMMFFAWALRTQALMWYERVAAVLAMVVLKGSFTGIVAAAAIGAAGIALPRLVRRLSGAEPTDLPGIRQVFSTAQRVPIALVLTLLLVALVVVRTQASYPGLTNIDPIAYSIFGSGVREYSPMTPHGCHTRHCGGNSRKLNSCRFTVLGRTRRLSSPIGFSILLRENRTFLQMSPTTICRLTNGTSRFNGSWWC